MVVHRSTGLLSVIVFFAILLIILSTTPSPGRAAKQGKSGRTYTDYVPRPKLPDIDSFRFSFHSPPVHKPPVQQNSTGKGSKWYSDWKWLNPFSSSITLDENRPVLPALRDRPPIYTFYDSTEEKEKDEKDADQKLLRAWRRAWFAHGFRPIVLGPAEAKNNPLYESFRPQELEEKLHDDFMTWLAWGNMGTGVFANWRCFPMGSYDDKLLLYLRRGSIPTHITRLERLGSSLFSGEKDVVNEAISSAFSNPKIKKAKSVADLVPPESFRIESSSSIAFYDSYTMSSRYPEIAEKTLKSPSAGRLALVELINSHLHTTFQNTFSAGIAVLKPSPENTTALVNPGSRLAALLAECPQTPIPKPCPPNNLRCKPCKPKSRLRITYPDGYKNGTTTFTIGAIPHPYTFISLQKGDDNVTTPYVRRDTERDRWLVESTKNVLGEERGGPSRVVAFKDIVAGNFGASRGLWFTVETFPPKLEKESLPANIIDELDWYFGFVLPRESQEEGGSPSSHKESLDQELALIEKARNVLKSKDEAVTRMRDVAEAWNLADTEVWRFVRAYR